MKVLIDTSLLLLCAEKGRDYLILLEDKMGEKHLYYVPSTVLRELKRLRRAGWKRGRLAAVALEIAGRLPSIDAGGCVDADRSLGLLAVQHGMAVATVDRALAGRLREMGVKVIMVDRSGSSKILG
jgi:rRNA-processing protein FCF1